MVSYKLVISQLVAPSWSRERVDFTMFVTTLRPFTFSRSLPRESSL